MLVSSKIVVRTEALPLENSLVMVIVITVLDLLRPRMPLRRDSQGQGLASCLP